LITPQWLVGPYSPVAKYDPEAKLSTPVGPESIENCPGLIWSAQGQIAMSAADKSGVAEPEESVIRDGKTADAEESGIRGWYRGDLNGAYQEWREGGKPEDPKHPLTEKLLSEARLYAGRMTQKVKRLTGRTRALANAANEKSIQRAMTLHDPNRAGGASFTTYLKNAVKHNIWDQLHRPKKPTLQKILLFLHNGDREVAHWWIDEERARWEETKKGLELVTRPSNIAFEDRPLAHWLLDQNLKTRITWRHVLRRFPDYKTEDTAGRALRRVKKAIEARFYRP
jgi:hypothetical protein